MGTGISIINYPGSKRTLMDFIKNNIKELTNKGDTVVDLFAGSGVVSDSLQDDYRIIANDSEKYSSLITDAFINTPDKEKLKHELKSFIKSYEHILNKKDFNDIVYKEEMLIKNKNIDKLVDLYSKLPTVWNNSTTPDKLKNENMYNLFEYYYSGTYFGLKQAIDIDCLIYSIHHQPKEFSSVLFASLFYAIKEVVFSKDGHMAQPLNIIKNPKRLIQNRSKDVLSLFQLKYNEIMMNDDNFNRIGNNVVYNNDFNDVLNDKLLKYDPKVIYADPPYTDMQYSRYYHILNVAANYDYPELSLYHGKYTKGLYTEGRNQSVLSKKSTAMDNLENLMRFSKNNNIKLVISYAFPVDKNKQHTDRYTVTIEELIEKANFIFGDDMVSVKKEEYKHANNRNKNQKKVYEYLIVCGKKISIEKSPFNVLKTKKEISETVPTSKNPLYNSHLYWSQKSFNIIDILIKNLSLNGEKVLDPFMGSGVTVLEAVKKDINRCGIGIDVNEMPVFIVKTLLSDMFNDNIYKSIDELQNRVINLKSYYKTRCPICNEDSEILKVVFDKPSRLDNKEVKIKSISYKCKNCKRQIKDPDKLDYKNMLSPNGRIENIVDEHLIPDSKLAVGHNDLLSYIFTPRNYKVLDEIVGIYRKNTLPNIGKYILMSILHLAKITDTHSNSQWPLWIPKINCVEKNVVNLFEKKLNSIRKTISFVRKEYEKNSIQNNFSSLKRNNIKLLTKGSQNINNEDIPDNSIGLIVTDPPYMGQVAYSEYLQLYKPFTDLQLNLEDEVIVSSAPNRKKDEEDYFTLLNSVFNICSKKLKLNRYMAMFFHDSNLKVWNKLINILENNGFQFVGQEHIKKSKTVKNILSPKKSLNGDAILFFINKKDPLVKVNIKTSLEDIEYEIYKLTKHLLQSGPKSTPYLYDNGLMEILITNGWLDTFSSNYKSLIEFLEKNFIWEKENSKWRIN